MKNLIFKGLTTSFSYLVFAIYLLLVSCLFYYFDWNSLKIIFTERIVYTIKLSIFCALLATLLSLIFAIPAGYALSRLNFWGKNAVDSILELPLIVSPSALGAMILIFFTSPFGKWFQENLSQVIFDIKGVIIAQFITTVGICTRLVKQSFDSIPKRYEDVAKSLGANNHLIFFKILLPNAKMGILYSAVYSFAKSIGEFGATITVAGSMPIKTETLPIAIYMQLSTVAMNETVICILLLLSISLTILMTLKLFKRSIVYA